MLTRANTIKNQGKELTIKYNIRKPNLKINYWIGKQKKIFNITLVNFGIFLSYFTLHVKMPNTPPKKKSLPFHDNVLEIFTIKWEYFNLNLEENVHLPEVLNLIKLFIFFVNNKTLNKSISRVTEIFTEYFIRTWKIFFNSPPLHTPFTHSSYPSLPTPNPKNKITWGCKLYVMCAFLHLNKHFNNFYYKPDKNK